MAFKYSEKFMVSQFNLHGQFKRADIQFDSDSV